jgi:hypothetical protein
MRAIGQRQGREGGMVAEAGLGLPLSARLCVSDGNQGDLPMKMRSLLPALLAGLTGVAGTMPAAALTYTVGTGGTYPTIQSAINAAIAHPGDDDVRVHVGVYNESLSVTAAMSADKLDISGGWEDGFFSIATDGAINTFVSPGVNQRGGLLQPSGGHLTVSDLHFYGAETDVDGAGLRIVPANTAVVTLFHDIFQENAVQTTGTAAKGGAISANVGSGGLEVLGCDFRNNRLAVLSGSAEARGAAINLQCSGTGSCTLSDNQFLQHSAQASSDKNVTGGAVNVELFQNAVLQVDRNTIEDVTVSGTPAFPTQGRNLHIGATDAATVLARGNRILAAASTGQSSSEVSLSARQGTLTISDTLVAKSGTRGMVVQLLGSGNAYLTNLTLADNFNALYVTATSTGQPYLNNSLITNVPGAGDLLPVVFSSNRIGSPVAFLAPSLYDYSLRRADAAVTDAGNDLPSGGLGALDISNGARIRGAHVDIGAWESSDRIFADRVDL